MAAVKPEHSRPRLRRKRDYLRWTPDQITVLKTYLPQYQAGSIDFETILNKVSALPVVPSPEANRKRLRGKLNHMMRSQRLKNKKLLIEAGDESGDGVDMEDGEEGYEVTRRGREMRLQTSPLKLAAGFPASGSKSRDSSTSSGRSLVSRKRRLSGDKALATTASTAPIPGAHTAAETAPVASMHKKAAVDMVADIEITPDDEIHRMMHSINRVCKERKSLKQALKDCRTALKRANKERDEWKAKARGEFGNLERGEAGFRTLRTWFFRKFWGVGY